MSPKIPAGFKRCRTKEHFHAPGVKYWDGRTWIKSVSGPLHRMSNNLVYIYPLSAQSELKLNQNPK